MNNANFKEIRPQADDYVQPASMLEIDDPFLLSAGGAPVLYGTLTQKDAAKAAYGTDRGFFCYLGDGLTKWAGPYLLCDNPLDADGFSSPKLVQEKSGDWLLFGKFAAENRRGIAIFRSKSPTGKFRFVSAFRKDADFAPFVAPSGRICLICVEGGALVRRELSENLLKLSTPEILLDKIKPTGAPAVLPESGEQPVIVLPTEKGLTLITASEKKGKIKWSRARIKTKLAAESVSAYTDPSGENLLVCGIGHGFALLRYRLKKGKLTVKDAILPYTEKEILAAQAGEEDAEDEKSGKKGKSGKGFHLNVNLGAVAAVTIALLSAGIGILMGLSAGKGEK